MQTVNVGKCCVWAFIACISILVGSFAKSASEPATIRIPDPQESVDLLAVKIHSALEQGNLARAKAILAENPRAVHARNKYGRTPLNVALEKGDKKMVKLLIAKGADVNAKEDNVIGLAPLHIAAFRDLREIAELLLAAGAEVNATEKTGKTALHGAAWHGQTEIAKLLIAAGADVNATDHAGKTALDYAKETDHDEIVDLLRSQGARKNLRPLVLVDVNDPQDLANAARRLFREDVTAVAPKDVSPLAADLCKPYKFYNVTVHKERYIAGFGPDSTYLMACGEQAFKLAEPKEVAGFLATVKKPVETEFEAFKKTLVFAELIDRTVRTHMPKRKSLIEQFAEQGVEDWQLVISGTDAGWIVSVTLVRCTRPENENSWRYDLKLDKDGAFSIAAEKFVYQYAALQ